MKKFLLLVMCFLMLYSCAVSVSAVDDGTYENAGQLYADWVTRDCVPDYITGVWSTDGSTANLTFGVVKGEAGEIGRLEILELVKDDATVTIVYQTYSRNYLYRIQDAVVDAYFEAGLGLVTAGVNEYENRLCFEVHIDFAENTDTLAMIRQVTEQYGDAVCFSYTDTYPQLSLGTQSPTPTGHVLMVTNPQNQGLSWSFTLALCGFILAFFLFLQIRKQGALAITEAGTPVVINELPVGKKEVKAAIRKAEVQPSESLDNRIMQSIQLDQ